MKKFISVMSVLLTSYLLVSCNSKPIKNERFDNLSANHHQHSDYIGAINRKILASWKRETYQMQLHPSKCTIHIVQLPGGKIKSVTITECRASKKIKDTIKRAVIKSSPLPYKGYEDLYTTNIVLVFIAQ